MSYIKINSKLIKNLDLTAETIKFLEENLGVNFCDLGLHKAFLDHKLHKNRLDFIKIKNVSALMDAIKKVK